MDRLILENEDLRVAIAPDKGASLFGFWTKQNGAWVALMPDVQAPGADLAAASFIMAPYSNRIANGTFAFEGSRFALAGAETHAIHGDVRKRPWRVTQATSRRACLFFTSVEHENVNWPWPFEVSVDYALDGATFTAHLLLCNRGESVMPAGLGFHPYLNRHLTRQGEPVRVCFAVKGIYPDAGGDRIPSGPPEPPDPLHDFSKDKWLPPDVFFDFCAWGYDGRGAITWPESGLRLAFDCSPELTHLVFYNPAKPYFAMEPVTNANDGVNLLARGDTTSGVRLLRPGESFGAKFALQRSLER